MRKEPNFNFSEGATFSDFQLSWNWPASGERAAEPPSCRATLWDFLLAHWPPVRCVLCTRTLRNVLGILFSTQAVWPHAKWRQHSSCYRSASVRVVMVAAPKSRYLPSEREKKLPFTAKRGALTTPRRAVEWVELAHRDCTLTPICLISLHAHEWTKQVNLNLYHRPDHGGTWSHSVTLVGKYWLRMTPHRAAK